MMDEKERKTRKISSAWKKNLFRVVLVLIVIFSGYGILSQFPGIPFGTIQVQGTNNRISREEVLSSAGLLKTNNILSIDQEAVERRLHQDMRMELIEEGYVWPFSYQIVIRERTISAYIPTIDGYVAVDRQGKVLQVQRRFGYMSAPLLTGVMLPPLLVGDIFQDETARIGLSFLVQLAERDAGDLSELNLSDSVSIEGYTLQGVPIYLGKLSELNEKVELAAQVLKEVAQSGQKIKYMDLKTKVPVVNFE